MRNTQQQIGIKSLDIVTLVVDDLDRALEFYTETLGFEKQMDEDFELDGEKGRWLTVGVPGQDLTISLVTAEEPHYSEETRELLISRRGTQTWWTFGTDDCNATTEAMRSSGVEITQEPVERPWGIEAMFADPFGNEFSLFEDFAQ